jgi:hypothetical protein
MMVEEFCEGHDSKSQEYMQPIKLKKKSWLHMLPMEFIEMKSLNHVNDT